MGWSDADPGNVIFQTFSVNGGYSMTALGIPLKPAFFLDGYWKMG
jgi:hypothetical protein